MAEEGQNNQGPDQDEERKNQDHINLRVVSQVCLNECFN